MLFEEESIVSLLLHGFFHLLHILFSEILDPYQLQFLQLCR